MTLVRQNHRLSMWLRAAGFAAVVWLGLAYMGARPSWFPIAAAVAAAALSFVSADAATLVAIVALSIPVVIVNPVIGVIALIVGVVGTRFLGAEGGRAFVIVGLTVAATFVGPGWAGAVLAGLLLGAADGAVAAALAAVAVQALGLVSGRESVGVLFTGGPCAPLLGFPCPVPVTSPSWLSTVIDGIDAQAIQQVIAVSTKANAPLLLIAQPLLWAGAAAIAGAACSAARRRHNLLIELAGVGASVLGLAAASVIASELLGGSLSVAEALLQAIISLAIVLIAVAVIERIFGAPKPRPHTTAADDAEVDELLRLIANAEETLAERHTVDAVVLMSDMKSFAEMTEQDGSVASAKAIQRHRDLLLPVVVRHGGRGKPSGGDGLVAAFDDADGALRAAAEMQRTLQQSNASKPGERPLAVRIGVARGEVVVDRSGRPFIGVGLNLAARVMALADGGQSFATAALAAEAPAAVGTRALGSFELKNIAEPVEVVEILWHG